MLSPLRRPTYHGPDTTLGAIDLEKEPAKIKGRELRFRKLTIEPNGIVPW
jgi:hypothetical protein